MEQKNYNCAGEEKKEFLNYLSKVLKDKETGKFKKTANHNKTEANKDGKRTGNADMAKIEVFDKTKKKRKEFWIAKDTSIALLGSIRNSKSLNGLYFECEWSVFRWIQQWLLHQDQVDLPGNLLQKLIEAACMLDAPLLLTTCLQFWRGNVRYVMKDGEWELLNENVITQFANLFNNCSLEELNDLGLQENLYQKFILFLSGPNPDEHLGHYETFSSLWKCKFCGKLVNEKTKSSECQFVAVNPNGEFWWAHSCDPDWSLSGLLTKLQGKRKQWRLVYWTLWTYCHFLLCSRCSQWFPVSQMNECQYHPRKLQHLVNKKSGNFLCCGKQCFPFQTIAKQAGCQFKAHTPILSSAAEKNILKTYYFLKNCNTLDEHLPIISEKTSLRISEIHKAEKNLVRNKHLPIRGNKYKKKIRTEGWLKHQTMVWNQDNQREQEERSMKKIQKFLSGKDEHKPSPQFHGGSYVNVEAEWWSNLQSKMRNITHE